MKYARTSGVGVVGGKTEQGVTKDAVTECVVVVVVVVDTQGSDPLHATPSAFESVEVVQVPNASIEIVVSPMYREFNLHSRDCLLRMRFLSIFSALRSLLC